MMDKRDILDDIASRSHGSANFGLGGQAVAEFYRENEPAPDQMLHMLAVALNDIAVLKERLERVSDRA